MNKKTELAIVLFIMCILLTSAICIQIRIIKNAESEVGTSLAEDSLRDEVLKWKDRYESMYAKLQDSENKLEKNREEIANKNENATKIETELKTANILLCLTQLNGTGITITIQDNQSIKEESVLDISYYLVHDEDLREVINELKNAGAEAISINDQRIISTTAITCDGNVILVNGEKISSPFVIKAIGSSEMLGGLSRPGGYIELLKNTGILVNMEKSKNITIPKYNGIRTTKYLKIIK